MDFKTEVYILAGFLGSGKTTLLTRLLENEKKEGRKVAVLMNELGEISIDSSAVDNGTPLKELLGGCICCTIQDKLEAQLQSLLIDHSPEAIYIETTGAAHPVEVIDAVLSPYFADKMEMRGIITTIDATLWQSRRSFNPQLQQLMLEQVRHADLLIINKSDLLSETGKAQISCELQSINSAAPCLLTSFSKVPLDMIKRLSFSSERKSESIPVHAKKNLRLGTMVHRFEKPVKKADFEDFLKKLPEGIYRIKGYIKFEGSSYPDLFQFSYGMPLFMKEYMNMPLNLVFIGQDIDWDELRADLNNLGNETRSDFA